MNLTILIPTKNRYPILLITLQYLMESGFEGEIIVADSSDEQINLNELIEYKKLSQINCIGLNIEESLYKSALTARTKYISYSGDDDLLIYSGIKKCVSFLDSNEEYAACTAQAGYIIINQKRKKKINKIIPYRTKSFEDNEIENRIKTILTNYVAPWFVYRTKNLIESLRICSIFKPARAREIYLTFDTLCNGKIKKLYSCMYVIRGIHNEHYQYANNIETVDADVSNAIKNKFRLKEIAIKENEELIMKISRFHCCVDLKLEEKIYQKKIKKFYSFIELILINILTIYWMDINIIDKYHKKYYKECYAS